MKRIVIPTDFSSNAYNACKLAQKLAKKTGAELHLLHVVFTPSDWDKMTDDMKSKYPESQHKVVEAEDAMKKTLSDTIFKGLKVSGTIAYGNPIEEINQFLAKHPTDMIVVGSHGTSNRGDLFIGSNTQRIMRSTKIPVVAVKSTYEVEKITKMVFASNFDADAEVPYKKISTICEALDVDLDLLFVNTPNHFKDSDEIEAITTKFLKKVGSTGTVHIRNDREVAQGILKYCKNNKMDMAVLINHRKAHAAHYLMGVTETLVFHAEFPVISINVS